MQKESIFKKLPATLITFFAFFVLVSESKAEIVVKKNAGLAVIRGVVRDKSGKPISKATVAVFKSGTSKILKQVTATKKGRFFAKIFPGTYTILAVAQGFNPVTLKKVKVNRSAKLVYGFKLERSGLGKTLPEKRKDRNSSKYRIRANHARRSIYQNQEGKKPIADEKNVIYADSNANIANKKPLKGQTVIEAFTAGNKDGNYKGLNFATFKPINEETNIVVAGQYGSNESAPKRLEAILNYTPNKDHKFRVKGAVADFGKLDLGEKKEKLGKTSFQLLDQWRIKNGIVLVVGFDYSKLLGAGSDSSINPRLGFQADINSRTRLRSAYTTQTESPVVWQRLIELEESQVAFRESVSAQDFAIENGKPLLEKNSRAEVGVERVLNNRSSLETNVFFDSVSDRGVRFSNLPSDFLERNEFDDLSITQRGNTYGVRAVYNLRLNEFLSFVAGYSTGSGQKFSNKEVSNNPSNILEDGFFQTFYSQLDVNLNTKTNIRTIYRLSSKATVFAIDPFQGRLTIFDPGLSVVVTQNLPNWGLPIDAEARIDARNIFDFQNDIRNENGILQLISHRSVLRGGVLVRF